MTMLGDEAHPSATAPTHVRHRVLGLLCLMSFILYLDRICISQAAKRMEADLDISHTAMGFVFGSFTLAYGLFQVPTGTGAIASGRARCWQARCGSGLS